MSSATDRAEAFVRSVVPSARLTESFKQVRVYQVPRRDMDVARAFPRFLDKPALARAGIEDWGLGQSSLEDVFINVCRRGITAAGAGADAAAAAEQQPAEANEEKAVARS